MMAFVKLAFVLLFAVANASVINEIKKRGYYDGDDYGEDYAPAEYVPAEYHNPAMNAVSKDARDVSISVKGVYAQLEGFARQFEVFKRHFEKALEAGLTSFLKNLKPLVEAAPAKVLKTLVINMMKTTNNLLKSFVGVYSDYNPLHPKKSSDFLSLLRRELTTLSTFGQSISTLLDNVDKLVVDYIDSLLVPTIEKAASKIDEVIETMEAIPDESFKAMALSFFQHL